MTLPETTTATHAAPAGSSPPSPARHRPRRAPAPAHQPQPLPPHHSRLTHPQPRPHGPPRLRESPTLPAPRPHYQDLTVEEDPSFGAEPLLRAPTVTVYLRLSSLWRERLEISRINLDQASVNLVRNDSGRWNISSLLLQAQRTTTAPTAQRRAASPCASPTLNSQPPASTSSADTKSARCPSSAPTPPSGSKTPTSGASVSRPSLPAPTSTSISKTPEPSVLKAPHPRRNPQPATAQPPRRVDRRRVRPGKPPHARPRQWLGGDLRAEADITGPISDLQLHSRLRVADAHRIEFTPLNKLDIDARCQAAYHHEQQSLDNLTCLWPTGDGHLLLTGSIPDLTSSSATPQPRNQSHARGLRRQSHRPHAPQRIHNVDATGTINGQFAWAPQAEGAGNIITGRAVADTVAIHIPATDQPITFAALRFTTPNEAATPASRQKNHQHKKAAQQQTIPSNILLLEPATFAAGAPSPMQPLRPVHPHRLHPALHRRRHHSPPPAHHSQRRPARNPHRAQPQRNRPG